MPSVRIKIGKQTFVMSEEQARALAKQGVLTGKEVEAGRFFQEGETELTGRRPNERRGLPIEPPTQGPIGALNESVRDVIPSVDIQPGLDFVNRGLQALMPGELPPGAPEDIPNPPLLKPEITKGGVRFAMENLIPALIPGGLFARAGVGGRAGLEALGQAAGSLAAETIDPSQEPASRALGTGAAGAAAGGVAGGVSRLRRGASGRHVAPGMEAANARAEALGTRGLTAGQMSTNEAVDFVETIAENSVMGRGIIRRAKEGTIRRVSEEITNLADDLGAAGPQAVGAAIEDAAQDGRAAFLGTGNALYARVDQLAPNARVSMGSVRQRARELAAENEILAPNVGRLLGEIERVTTIHGPNIPMSEARRLRSTFLAIERGAEGDIHMEAIERAGKELARLIDDRIVAGFNASQPTGIATAAFRRANEFWADGAERFNKKLINALAKKDPEQLYQLAVKNKAPSQIRQLREAVTLRDTPNGRVTDPAGLEAWRHVQGQALNDILSDAALRRANLTGVGGRGLSAAIAEGGVLDVNAITQRMRSLGDEAFETIFDPSQVKIVRENLDILAKATNPGKGQQPLAVALSLGQAGAIWTLGSGLATLNLKKIGAGSALLIGPTQLAKLVTNPTTKRWLTTGLKAPPGSEARIRAVTRFIELAIREGAQPIRPARPNSLTEEGNAPRGAFSATVGGPRTRPVER